MGYLDPSTLLTFRYWGKTGNFVKPGQFLGSTNNQAIVFKFNNIQAGLLDKDNTSFGTSSIIGAGSKNTAIGVSASAANSSTAIGASAVTSGKDNTALGVSATASTSTQETAIGASSLSNNQNNTAVGYNASAITNKNVTAIGANTSASGTNSTVIGYNAKTTQDNAVVIGDASTANLYVGIGTSTPSAKLDINAAGSANPLELHGLSAGDISSDYLLSIDNTTGVVYSIPQSTVSGAYWNLGGNAATASSFLGTTNNQPLQFKYNSIAAGVIDNNNTSLGTNSTIGAGANNLAIGNASSAASSATAVGGNSIATGKDNTALGNSAAATTSTQETAIGASSLANAQNNTAIGYNASAITGQKATAIGANATASGSNSTAIGYNAQTSQANTVLLGDAATAGLYVGIGTATPTSKLDIVATGAGNNPLELHGVPTGNLSTDNLLTINSLGIVGTATSSSLGGSFIQNQTTQQASSNFNISGTGTTGGLFTSNGGHTNAGIFTTSGGIVNINASSNFATNINTGTSNGTVTIGGNSNNINLPKLSASSVVLTDASKNLTSTTPSANTFLYYNGTNFIWQSTLPSMWSLTGNSGTTPGTNFIGTTDNKDLVFKTNATEAFRATATNRIGIGTATPSYILSLNGDANQTFGMERSTTTNGLDLTIQSGSSKAAVGNKSGGDLYLNSGIATGTGSSNIYLQTSTSGAPGSTDNPLTTKITILGSGNVGIGNTNPSNKLSVIASSDPLYLSGVQATAAFATDSLLTIYNGVVKKSPYSSLPGGNNWSLTGNSGTNGTVNFLGTTDAQPLVIKSLNRQLAYFDGNLYSIALGYGAVNGSSDHNVAIGYNATTNNQYTLALGYGATATGVRSIAIGNGAPSTIASGAEAIAIGYNAISSNVQSTALGYQATASGSYGVALGYSALASASQSTAIGYSSLASAQYANAIGYQAQATGLQSTAIGYRAQTAQSNTILLGDVATTNLHVGIGTATPTAKLDIVGTAGNNPLEMQGVPAGVFGTDNFLTINASGVVGYVTPASLGTNYWGLTGNAAASGNFLGTTNTTPLEFKFNSTLAGHLDANNTSFGTSASATNNAVAIGENATASQLNNTAVGNDAKANVSSQATAIGALSQALFQNNIAVGYNAQATVSNQETVIGASAQAQGQNNIAIGYSAKANNSDKITVVGSNAQASFQNNTVLGSSALATTNNQATAIGATAVAQAQNATALGYGSSATGINSTAIGASATTSQNNALILGTSTTNVGIATSAPVTTASLDVNAKFKLGDVGTVEKNIVSTSAAVNASVPSQFSAVTILAISVLQFASGTNYYDATITLPSTLTSTQASVSVSPSFDLPAGVSIAFARAISTTQVKVRFVNASTAPQTITGNLYVTATEF